MGVRAHGPRGSAALCGGRREFARRVAGWRRGHRTMVDTGARSAHNLPPSMSFADLLCRVCPPPTSSRISAIRCGHTRRQTRAIPSLWRCVSARSSSDRFRSSRLTLPSSSSGSFGTRGEPTAHTHTPSRTRQLRRPCTRQLRLFSTRHLRLLARFSLRRVFTLCAPPSLGQVGAGDGSAPHHGRSLTQAVPRLPSGWRHDRRQRGGRPGVGSPA